MEEKDILVKGRDHGERPSDEVNPSDSSCPPSPGRRRFIGALGAACAVASFTGFSTLLTGCHEDAIANGILSEPIGPLKPNRRANVAFKIRKDAAQSQKQLPLADNLGNGDEEVYPNKIANYSKGLPHNGLGEVDNSAYDALISALSSGDSADFENVLLAGDIKLKNPESGLAFEMMGADSHHLEIPPAPSFDSAEEASEIAELYWMALARDVHYQDYATNPITNVAAADLSTFSDFRGPKSAGSVTPATLFRADIPGVLTGPFLSQFFLKNIPAGPQIQDQRIRTLLAVDYQTSYSDWLDAQNGILPPEALSDAPYDPVFRYIRNGRDNSEANHWDWPAQSAVNALLIIFGLEGRSAAEIFLANIGVHYNVGNPYNVSQTQAGFVTFHIVDSVRRVIEAMNSALKAAWYQKWYVHRRLRPEEFSGRIHNHMMGAANYPIHPDIINSPVLGEVFDLYGTFLLPQAYPEGGPAHPAYPSGHATWAGATITVLKAFFDESAVVPDPVVASADGLSLDPYTGPGFDQLTVGGELNKLAWNIAMGRNFSGIHWRTDAIEGLRLGESVALGLMRDMLETYNEDFGGFTFTKFDAEVVTV